MSDKALLEIPKKPLLTDTELEVTQRIQRSWPRGMISKEHLHFWNTCPKELLVDHIRATFGQLKYQVAPDFLPVWKKFSVGRMDWPTLKTEIAKEHVVEEHTGKLIDNLYSRVSPLSEFVLFGKVTLELLGFRKNPKGEEWLHPKFFSEWSAKNLQDGWVMEMCTIEEVLHVRRQYKRDDQPLGEIMWGAHDPVFYEGHWFLLYLERNQSGDSGLSRSILNSKSEWNLRVQILVRFRKVALAP